MSRYTRGRDQEYRAQLKLTEGGWYVIRSAGSHGAADLVALGPGIRLLVQCKAQLATVTWQEWTQLWQLGTELECQPCIHAKTGLSRTAQLWLLTGPRERYARQPWDCELAPWDMKEWMWLT